MDSKKIGQTLRALRGDKSVQKVAHDNGISPSAVSMYEAGLRVPKDDTKVRLAAYYGVPVESIFFASEVHDK
ncbi:MAG: helix-turn-helix transcriptional regulator [Clostridia bacterium]|nr:helix-turn-helix transcriptional regulator [Clostridia bacterium]